MKISKRHYLAAIVALAFLFALPPVEARASTPDDEGCWACESCYPNLWCTGCGIYVMYAITGCCGMGSGTAYCLPDWGGFAVNCDSGANACQCNMTGEHCGSLLMNGG